MISPADLPDAWRAEAERLRRRYGDEARAKLCESLAQELEEALAAAAAQPVSREQLAEMAGVHPDSVSRAAREGRIRREGRLFVAGDAPKLRGRKRRKGGGTSRPDNSHGTLDAFDRRAIANRTRGGGARA